MDLEMRDKVNAPIIKEYSGPTMKVIFGVAFATLSLLVCTTVVAYYAISQITNRFEETELSRSTVPLLAGPPTNNHIAYIGNDNNVWVIDPAGEQPRKLTNDGRGYRFPTWAPDSRRLAFLGPDDDDNTALYISPTTGGEPTIVFDDKRSAPFYLYWAPDSQTITFLTQESSGLAMRQVNVNGIESNRIIEEGEPFYWVWSPAGDKLLMHVGGSRGSSREAHISLVDNKAEAERVELDLAPGNFQAPAWSSDGSNFFFIAENNSGGESIYKTNATTLEEDVLTNLSGFTYLVLSPDDNYIAYLQIERGNRPPFGTAYIVDTEGQKHTKITERPVGSMYWSPDGRKLALLTLAQREDGSSASVGGLASPLPQQLLLRWWIYDVESGNLDPLISLAPTVAFLQTVPYFDQYHLSLTFWSPDSRYFVITKEDTDVPGDGTVWIVDTTAKEEPRQIGEGRLGVWSWK